MYIVSKGRNQIKNKEEGQLDAGRMEEKKGTRVHPSNQNLLAPA